MSDEPRKIPPACYPQYLRARNGDLVSSRHFPHRPDHLFLIEIALTYACQCRCQHCAVSEQPREGTLLSCAEIVELCRQAKEELGASVVELFGGEPLLRPDLEEIVAGCSPYLTVWLSTNGLAFTRERAERLSQAGLKLAIFSLDSTDPAEHDRIRGVPGCFAAVMEGLAACRETGIRAHLSACVTPQMIHSGEADRLIAFAAQSQAEKLCLLPAKMMGRFAGHKEILCTQEEMARLWEKMQAAGERVYVETETNTGGNIGKCFALRDWLYVGPYGTVQPCVYVFLDFGNVREHSLAFLYRRMFEHPIFQDKSLLNVCLCQNPAFIRKHLSPQPGDGPLRKVIV